LGLVKIEEQGRDKQNHICIKRTTGKQSYCICINSIMEVYQLPARSTINNHSVQFTNPSSCFTP